MAQNVENNLQKPEIAEEVDKPFPQTALTTVPEHGGNPLEAQMTNEEREKFELDKAKDKHNHWLNLNKYAFKMLIGCLVVLVVLYITDTVVVNLGWQNSSVFATVFEFTKYITTTLLGFLFATKLTQPE